MCLFGIERKNKRAGKVIEHGRGYDITALIEQDTISAE